MSKEDSAMEDKSIKTNETEVKKGGSAALNPEELKAKYGKVYQLDLTLTPDDDTEIEVSYIFKKPTTASYDRYVKTGSNGMTKALKTFMFDNIIPEHRDKLEADLEEYPALTLSAGEKLLSMLGLSKTANLMKL